MYDHPFLRRAAKWRCSGAIKIWGGASAQKAQNAV